MAYCGPRGIPHSHFLGGPQEWTEDDQQKALWWLARDRQTCSGCGTHPDDWDPDAGGSRDAFEAEEQTCPGCRMRASAEAALEAARKNDPTSKYGTRIVLVRPGADDD